jgi:hypothetical protein
MTSEVLPVIIYSLSFLGFLDSNSASLKFLTWREGEAPPYSPEGRE